MPKTRKIPPYQITLITHGTPEYDTLVALRLAVLRAPLGLEFTPAQLAAEHSSHHLACYSDGVLVGCLVLAPRGEAQMQMRQVAVRNDWQGRGVGRVLVARAEALACQQGAKTMVLHARESAVGFYEALGYQKQGERFWEVTLPHWKMTKTLG